jgi:hypothetical protein
MEVGARFIRLDEETQAFFSLAQYHADQRAKEGRGDREITQEDSDWAAMEQLIQSKIALSHLAFVREMAIVPDL